MKISKIIEQLQQIKEREGDIEGLIEIMGDDVCYLAPVDELAVEDRAGYGVSVAFLQ